MHPLLHCGALLDATFEKYLVRFRAGRRGSETVWAGGEQIHRWREQGYTYLQIALELGLHRSRCEQLDKQHRRRRAQALRSFCQLMQTRLGSPIPTSLASATRIAFPVCPWPCAVERLPSPSGRGLGGGRAATYAETVAESFSPGTCTCRSTGSVNDNYFSFQRQL